MATFFCLSATAREHPQIVRRLVETGHDVGSHGESHDLVYEMTPERFREETRHAEPEEGQFKGSTAQLRLARALETEKTAPLRPPNAIRAKTPAWKE